MAIKFNTLIWRSAVLILTLVFWVSLVAAQEEVEVVEETTNFGPIWVILLAGLGAVAMLGFAMYSRDASDREDNS
ncbi:MAG: hypothetical protein Q9P01_06530 [Anaerolineae bacterium]|nr:hypothetical protein [Anaerolineae bacterium]MDQ7034488.1 hypothetical protein [Anaerolineae bacterium]